jgi:hypothetical protein
MSSWWPPTGLAVRLPAVAERRQQPLHVAGADLMPLLLQRGGELLVAFRHPQYRAHRIAERRRLDHAAQILDQRCVPARKTQSASTLATVSPPREWRRVEFFLCSADGRAREPRELRDRLNATPSCDKRFPGRKQPPTALIELRAYPASHLRRIACLSITPTCIMPQRTTGNPAQPSQFTAWRRFNNCDGCPNRSS